METVVQLLHKIVAILTPWGAGLAAGACLLFIVQCVWLAGRMGRIASYRLSDPEKNRPAPVPATESETVPAPAETSCPPPVVPYPQSSSTGCGRAEPDLFSAAGIDLRVPADRPVAPPARTAPDPHETEEGISIVVVVRGEDYGMSDERLPLLLAQDYPRFEVVIVSVGADAEFRDHLKTLAAHDRRIALTRIDKDPRFPVSRKLSLNVGIKAARYERVVLTRSDCRPASSAWLQGMAHGFAAGRVVLGLSAPAAGRARHGRLLAADNLARSARWLAAAVRRRPYRGTACNLGLERSLYFAVRGFDHLNLDAGEDDLFVQHLTRGGVPAVPLLDRQTVMLRDYIPGGWWTDRLDAGRSFVCYPPRQRIAAVGELWSRTLFFGLCIASALVLPGRWTLLPAALFAVRWGILALEIRRLGRRTGQTGLVAASLAVDLATPAIETALCAARRLSRKPERRWRP